MRLRLALVTLNVDSAIAGPQRTIDPVAGTPLPGFPKKVVTNLAQVFEAYPFRVSPHIGQNSLNGCHRGMVSLLILKSRCEVRHSEKVLEAYYV
jgi:hypothetical protein